MLLIIQKTLKLKYKFIYFTSSSGFAFSLITLTLSLHLIGILCFTSSLLDPFEDLSLLDAAA